MSNLLGIRRLPSFACLAWQPATKPANPGNSMTKLIRSSLPLLFSLFLSACSFSLAEDITPPPGAQQPVVLASTKEASTGPLYPLVPPAPQAGAALFAENCAPCHGATGLGNGPDASQLPMPVAAIGTAPALRLGEDLPRGVALQWAARPWRDAGPADLLRYHAGAVGQSSRREHAPAALVES